MDFGAAGLLDGLEGEERTAREHLLERLVAEGFSLDELRGAVAERRLALLPVERLLGGTYSAAEIEERTGVPASRVLRIQRLLGLPEPGTHERVFDDDDLAAAQSTRQFLEGGFSEEAIAEITRVLGEAMARFTATITAAFADSFLEPGDTEEAVARRFAALAERFTPAAKPVLIAAFKQHLRESVRRGVIGRAELESGGFMGEQDITVCFADLVGFTRLGGEVEAGELGSVAGRLAELASEVATPPVRLVKTIGDAAMFVSAEPGRLVNAALSLLEAVEAAELPALRAGIAFGPALFRAGDYYGNSVNLGSRVTGVARPGSVLATQEVRDATPDEFDWSYAGRYRLKGVPRPVPLYRARRHRPTADHGSDRRGRAKARRGG
jgi:adenylate cyclase